MTGMIWNKDDQEVVHGGVVFGCGPMSCARHGGTQEKGGSGGAIKISFSH